MAQNASQQNDPAEQTRAACVIARCQEVCMLFPQSNNGHRLENRILYIAKRIAVANQANPVSPVNMASTNQAASSIGKARPAHMVTIYQQSLDLDP